MQAPRDDRNTPLGTGRRPASGSTFSRIERVPPLLMLLYLALLGITMLFITLVAMYVASRAQSEVASGIHPFPRYFSLSTVVLLVSSYTLAQAPRLYRADDLTELARIQTGPTLRALAFRVAHYVSAEHNHSRPGRARKD